MTNETRLSAALQRGRAAFQRRRWAEAYELLSAADDAGSLGVGDLELLAASAYLIGKDQVSDDLWVRAHNECLRGQDVGHAARCIFWLVIDLLTRGEMARAGGWLARAQRLLDEGRHDCPERALLLVLVARMLVKRGDLRSADDAARRAVEIGNRFDDPEAKVFGRLALGQACARQGKTGEAAALFDEVMVAVTAGDVSPIAVGVVYCAVIDSCHYIFDLQRAREWTLALSRWCASQRDLVPFRGQCLVHRAEILRLSGAWSQAADEAEQACALLSELASVGGDAGGEGGLPSFKYPIGAAHYELAEIHRVRGDFARAAEHYRRASRHARSPEPGLALLRLCQGRPKDAAASIRRVLTLPQTPTVRADSLSACVEIMIAMADLQTARAAAIELESLAAASGAPLLRAMAARAMGSVLLGEGDASAALASLRTAWMAWQELEAPYEAARVRVLLGLACRELLDDEAAELELDAARRVFERLAAAPDLARVNALLGLGARRDARALTARELQVLGLVATGSTNRAIAERLAISERTVDRHVSNILSKLDLESRSAATAYAYEHRLL